MPFSEIPFGTPGWIGTVAPFGEDPTRQLYVWGVNGRDRAVIGLRMEDGTIIQRLPNETCDDLRQRVRHDFNLCPQTNKYNTAFFVYGGG
jgi:hypothetical protein